MGGCQGSNGKLYLAFKRHNAPGEQEQSMWLFLIWEIPST